MIHYVYDDEDADEYDDADADEYVDADEDDYNEDDEEDGVSDVGRAISGQEGVLKGASPHSYCVAAYCAWHIAYCIWHMLTVAYYILLPIQIGYCIPATPLLLCCCLVRMAYCT